MADGLDGIVAADTVLSHTDPAKAMVWVRGHDLPSLVANHGFEGTVALLWDGFAGHGLTRAAISRLENSWTLNPTLETLFRYTEALGVTLRLAVDDPTESGKDD